MISEYQVIRDIAELRTQLDRIEKKLDLVLGLLPKLNAGGLPQPTTQIVALLRSGHRLQAIKAYKEASGLTAEQAEAVIEGIELHEGPTDSMPTGRNSQ